MKKVLFVLAFVAVYGVSMAMTTQAEVVSVDETVTVVADADEKVEKVEKAEKKESKKAAKAEAKADGCSGSKAKAKACSGEKTAKKSGCASSCGGK